MPIQVQSGVLQNVDGSAELEINGVRVVCGVNGPMEARPRQELPTQSYLEVIIRPDTGVASTREKLMEDKIRSFLANVVVGTLYPRQVVQVNLQILANKNLDPGVNSSTASNTNEEVVTDEKRVDDMLPELNCCVNAACMALIDANVSVHAAFNSNIFSYFPDSPYKLVANPVDVVGSVSTHLVVYAIKNGQVDNLLLSENVGAFSEDKLYAVLERGAEEAARLHSEIRSHLVGSLREKFIYLS